MFNLPAVSSKVILCVLPIANIVIGKSAARKSQSSGEANSQRSAGLMSVPAVWPTGAVYLHDCPRQPFIPIYLIVMGVFGIVLTLLSCLPCARQNRDEPPNPLSRVCVFWNSLTSTFLFCWFIAGEC